MAKFEREVSSGGVILRSSNAGIRVLLIKDPYGKWTWPKGKIDKGEGILQAAVREIAEETGLRDIKPISRLAKTNYYYKRDGKLIYKTVYVYLFGSAGREALKIQKSEIDDGRWFAEEDALEKAGYRGAKTVLKKALHIFKQQAKNKKEKSYR